MSAPLGLTSRILVAIIHCLVAAISPASCSSSLDRGGDVIGFSFPSTEGPQYDGSELMFSWDAGVLGRALHLTADGVYEPPVVYSPDSKRSAGHVSISQGIPLALESKPFDYDDGQLWSASSQEASFNTIFTMSISRPHGYKADDGGLLFEVLPQPDDERHWDGLDRAIYFPLSTTASGSNISVEIGKLEYYYHQGLFGLYVSIVPPAPTTPYSTPANYTVWIDYDAKRHNLSVYVDDEGKAKPGPGQATLHSPLSIIAVVSGVVRSRRRGWHNGSPDGSSKFGLFASKNRLLPSCQPVVYSWNLTVDRLWYISSSASITYDHRRRRMARVFFYLVLVAAPAAAIVFLGAWCLVSRYRALTMKLKLSKAMRRLPGIPREFGYAAVKKATRNFHESMRLGSGGFGAVYKGAMIATCDGDDGRQRLQYVEVAVKMFTRKENSSYDDFLAEVAVINRLRHRNIVPLIGWCYENGELLLIYQYMPNGSLDQHLFGEKRHQQLPILQWQTRYDVIKDIAAGLHYVHHEYERAVLHRDIKASNIMLDADFRGRLGDFGLARVVAFDKTSFTDMGVAGTWGFIAPEYAVSHKATRQTDVYAFGVLVLEVVTGKRSLGAADSTFPLLMDWVWWLHGEGRLLEAVEDELTTMGGFSSDDNEDASRLLLLGLACSNPNPSDRPSMDQVVQVIAKSMPPPAVPLVKPAFVWPPEGEQLLLSDNADDDDDFVESDHRDSDRRHWEETEHCDSLATGIKPSSVITQRKSRNVVETNISQDIEKCV